MKSITRIATKIFSILNREQKIGMVKLLFLMVVAALFEMLSVSLVLPFMQLAINPQGFMENEWVIYICRVIRVSEPGRLMAIITVSVILIFVVKNIYLIFENNLQYRYVYGGMFETQKKILKNILFRPYDYFLNANSGEVMRMVGSDTTMSFEVILTFLELMSEVVITFMLLVTVFVIAPAITLIIVFVVLALMFVFFAFIKPAMKKIGLDNQNAATGMNTWIIQSVQGIKEVKAMSGEAYFQRNFEHYGKRYINTLRRRQVLSVTPRYIIEAVCISVMFGVVSFLMIREENVDTIIPIVTAVGMAAVRMLPSANRISVALGKIAFGEPMVDKLIENLNYASEFDDANDLIKEDSKESFSFNEEILFDDISFAYSGTTDYVIENASFSVKKGETIGIMGVSGAGKSTAIDIILGLLYPQKGCVRADGRSIEDNVFLWRKHIGYIPQSIFLLDDTIRANVIFGETVKYDSDERVLEALNSASLKAFIESLPEGLDTIVGERGVRLSGGQIQRLGIARALYRKPDILIFDEATSALDNETESGIMEAIERMKGQKTMIIIAHRLSTIKGCDRILKVEDKKITEVSREEFNKHLNRSEMV